MKLGDMTIRQVAEICRGKERCWLCPFYNDKTPMMCKFDGKVDPDEWNIDEEIADKKDEEE